MINIIAATEATTAELIAAIKTAVIARGFAGQPNVDNDANITFWAENWEHYEDENDEENIESAIWQYIDFHRQMPIKKVAK